MQIWLRELNQLTSRKLLRKEKQTSSKEVLFKQNDKTWNSKELRNLKKKKKM